MVEVQGQSSFLWGLMPGSAVLFHKHRLNFREFDTCVNTRQTGWLSLQKRHQLLLAAQGCHKKAFTDYTECADVATTVLVNMSRAAWSPTLFSSTRQVIKGPNMFNSKSGRATIEPLSAASEGGGHPFCLAGRRPGWKAPLIQILPSTHIFA